MEPLPRGGEAGLGLADWAGPAEVGGAVGVVAVGQAPWKGQAAQLGMELNEVGRRPERPD